MKKLLFFIMAVLTSLLSDAHGSMVRPESFSSNVADPPTANDDISSNNVLPNVVSVPILSNDVLSTGAAISFLVTVDVDTSEPGIQNTLTVPGQGTWQYDGIFYMYFSPEPGLLSDPTPITYTLTENGTGLSDQATVTITFLKKPVATNDLSINNIPGVPASVAILSNDFLANGSIPQPANVSVDIDLATTGIQGVLAVAGEGTWNYDSSTGLLTFTATPGFTAAPTPISYTLTSSTSFESDPATVTIGYATMPEANNDISSNNVAGSQVSIQILANDLSSSGIAVSALVVSIDLDRVTTGPQSTLIVPDEGTWVYDGLGTLTFVPVIGLISDPTPVTYTLTEVFTALSDQATVTVSYQRMIKATNDIASGVPASTVVIPILENDYLADGSTPAPEDVSVDVDLATPGIQSILFVPGEGSWLYTPFGGVVMFNPDFSFFGIPTPIAYTLTDAANIVSAPATITVTFASRPAANDDASLNNTPGSTVALPFLVNDFLSNGMPAFSFAATIDIDPSKPGNQLTRTVANEGFWTFDGIFLLSFFPDPSLTGNPTPLTYALTDNTTGLSDQGTVTVTYLFKPVATNDESNNNTPGVPVSIAILDNDFLTNGSTPGPLDVSVDIDLSTPGIQVALVVTGQGTWNYDPSTGLLTFTPAPGFTTAPTPISYTLTDAANDVSDPATVTIGYPPRPAMTDDVSDNNVVGSSVFILALANDVLSNLLPAFPFFVTIDIDASTPGPQSTLIVPGEGTWFYDLSGIFSFVPESGLAGDPTPIIYTLTESMTGASGQATITIHYLIPPVAHSRNATIPTPSVGATLVLDGLNGRPAPLSGSDVQDGNMGTGSTFVIANVDGLNGNTLLYNNVPITAGPFTIANYDPALLTLKFTGVGSMALAFNYLVTDSQGLSSSEVAYELTWEDPMPVTLISFDAKAEGSRVILSWATSEESNSDHFEVQRSDDGPNWQSLDQVSAAGMSSGIRQYAFTDEHPLAGQNLFRLKMVDTDNSYAYSQIRSVQVMNGQKITMSPNPVSDMLTIDLPSWKDVSALTIFDQNGTKRSSVRPTSKTKIDVRQFQTGIYMVVIHYNNGRVYAQRVLVK